MDTIKCLFRGVCPKLSVGERTYFFEAIDITKMRLLIISDCFYPNNVIGAFRIEAFAKYFQLAGYSVTVVTEGEADETNREWFVVAFYCR